MLPPDFLGFDWFLGFCFLESNLATRGGCCFHFHFPAQRGHAKIPQGRMLRVVFLLETESRSAAGLAQRCGWEFYSPVFQDLGGMLFLEKHLHPC